MPKTPKQSGKLERVAELAIRLGGKHLADYVAACSCHDLIQQQLMNCLILRAYLKIVMASLLSFALALLSYHLVEGRFMAFKRFI